VRLHLALNALPHSLSRDNVLRPPTFHISSRIRDLLQQGPGVLALLRERHRGEQKEHEGPHTAQHTTGVPLEAGMTLTQFALRWILMFDAVTCAIPGAKRPAQVEENAAASNFPPLTAAQMQAVERIYNTYAKQQVHQRW
jgi:aryl-alcohol dehydrogenase-like predicted oxidoreductase